MAKLKHQLASQIYIHILQDVVDKLLLLMVNVLLCNNLYTKRQIINFVISYSHC